ncbi:MAG: hypothetical protein Q4A74_09410 [Cardiobacteriaceae bacterium]|nr:hypothetical protein [Cardiobacteriaceae bacterium]
MKEKLNEKEILAIANRPWAEKPEEDSDLRILKSAAGYYVGRVELDEEGHEWPFSRESDYYRSKEKAEDALKFLIELENTPLE